MANRFNFPRETALDANGDPISGAKLNFWESGTTTRLDTYSDNALTTANANPVVADSAGRFGDIFLQASNYKVVLTDSDDVTIWTADPVAGTIDVTGDEFAPSQQSVPDLTIQLVAGQIFNIVSKALVVVAAQSTSSITAPSSNPRKDIVYVDRLTGVIGVQTGAEGASPSDPTIADDKLPVARITLATTTTEITDSLIDDIRELNLLGAGDVVRYTFVDEDDMTSDSAVKLPSQQSVKAYVDASVIDNANQTQMEAAASADVFSSPARQHFHPGHPKVWVNFAGSDGTIGADYGVTSVTDQGDGDYSVNLDTAMSSTDYAVWALAHDVTAGAGSAMRIMSENSTRTKTVSVFNVLCQDFGGGDKDPVNVSAGAFGDQ